MYYRIFKVIRTRAKNAALSKNSTIRNKNQLNNNDNNNNNNNTVKTKLLNGSGNEKEKINLLSEGIFKLKNSKTVESNENNLSNLKKVVYSSKQYDFLKKSSIDNDILVEDFR